jgi:capsular polysaccharide biosynthesis protein
MNESYGTRSLRELVRIVFQHWMMMLLILIVGGGGTYFVCESLAPRTYRSQISLIFKRPLNKSPVMTDTIGERVLEVFVKAQQQILMSDMVLARAKVIAENPSLRKKWKELRDPWEAARQDPKGGAALKEAQKNVESFLKSNQVDKPVKELLTQKQREFDRFRRSIKLETPGGEQVAMTESFTITVDRPASRDVADSHLAATFAAETIADMYLVRYQELQLSLNAPAENVMQNVMAEFEKRVDDKRDAYQAFIVANKDDIGGLEQLLKSGTEQGLQIYLTEIRKSDATLFLNIAKEKAMLDVLAKAVPAAAMEPGGVDKLSEEQVSATVQSIPIDFFAEDAAYVELAKSAALLAGRLARAESQYLEESRDIQYLREQVKRTQRQLLNLVVAHVRGLSGRLTARESQKKMNDALVDSTNEKQSQIHLKLAEYARLKTDFETTQKHLALLQQEEIDAMSMRVRSEESITIRKLNEASVPNVDSPVVPLTNIYTIVAVLVSLLLGLALAFLADHFDHTLRTTIEAERYTGLPVLGSVKRQGRSLVLPT